MEEYYIGQVFENDYPSDAAVWCNNNNAYIDEISSTDNVKVYEIKEIPEPTPEERRAMLDLLSLTKREVFLALYKDKGITPEQLKAQITDPEALIEFEYASDYFRGNPLINQIGMMLGYSSDDLDYLFEHKQLPEVE